MWYVPQHESPYSVSVTEGKVTAVDSARGGLSS
jgi:hypothetical protein